jgi:hypothetical protein
MYAENADTADQYKKDTSSKWNGVNGIGIQSRSAKSA